MRWATAAAFLGMLTFMGCEGGAPPPTTTAEATNDGAVAPPAPEPKASDRPRSEEPAAKAPAAEPMPQTPVAQPAAEPEGTAEKAAVGAGAKGRDYGGEGFVTTPVEAFFRTGDRIAFEIHVPKNLQLYKAEHNNKGPKSHEEFMKVIIQEGGVELPELPEGDSYWYDAKTETLMVRHPK